MKIQITLERDPRAKENENYDIILREAAINLKR